MRYTHVEHPFLGPPGVRLWLVARGVIGLGGLAPGYYALHYISLSDATALAFLAPVLVGDWSNISSLSLRQLTCFLHPDKAFSRTCFSASPTRSLKR